MENVLEFVGALLEFGVPTFEHCEFAVALGQYLTEGRALVDDLAEPAQAQPLAVLPTDHERTTSFLTDQSPVLDPTSHGALGHTEVSGERLRVHVLGCR